MYPGRYRRRQSTRDVSLAAVLLERRCDREKGRGFPMQRCIEVEPGSPEHRDPSTIDEQEVQSDHSGAEFRQPHSRAQDLAWQDVGITQTSIARSGGREDLKSQVQIPAAHKEASLRKCEVLSLCTVSRILPGKSIHR